MLILSEKKRTLRKYIKMHITRDLVETFVKVERKSNITYTSKEKIMNFVVSFQFNFHFNSFI